MSIPNFVRRIRQKAYEIGFDEIGITEAYLPTRHQQLLEEFIQEKNYGTMDWLTTRVTQRCQPTNLWPEARSVIVTGVNYGPKHNPLALLQQKDKGNISVYARHRDYHDLLKGWLKHLAQFVLKESKYLSPDTRVKVFVDTAPVMEKPLAAQAGIGWQGKHTNLVSRKFGSWLFLGEIFTNLDLPQTDPFIASCGRCDRCLKVCPTQAFPAPYKLDARRCISYLTIEHTGPIPKEFRSLLGNRIYGCDDCLAICPWNRFAQTSRHIKLQARIDLIEPPLAVLGSFSDEEFRQFFSGSPIKRIGHTRFIRNVLIAIGNSHQQNLLSVARKWILHPDPTIQETAQWAMGQFS